jgi:hypothetical protein
MTLDQYLSLPGSPNAGQFGELCKRGDQNITRDTMRVIITASGGLISPDGLIRAKPTPTEQTEARAA